MSYYNDIYTMPVYNWFKIIKTGNLGFLSVDSTFKPAKKVEEEYSRDLLDLWHDINNQYYDEFGQSELYRDIIEKKKELAVLMAEFLESNNKAKLTYIDIKKNELDHTTPKNKEYDYNKEVGEISLITPYPINIKKMSVYEYHTIKESIKNGNRKY